ncbi:unnamed protein product [Closterium sp. NIES-54]
MGEGERVKRGVGGGADGVQQAHDQVRGRARTPSTCASACTPSTSSASTKCSPATAPIGCRAFGKPQGVCARVAIGQVLLSVRCKEANAAVAAEALRRAKFKFPGRQKVIASRKWAFTKIARADFVKWKQENRLVHNGVNAKVGSHHTTLMEPPLHCTLFCAASLLIVLP